MKERPILFSAPMVRAILEGHKTQTRRIAPIADLNIRPNCDDIVTWGVSFSKPVKGSLGSYSGGKFSVDQARRIIASLFNPYGVSGDRLWVKETYYAWGRWETRYNSKKVDDEWHFVDMTVDCGRQYRYPVSMAGNIVTRQRGDVMPQWWKRPAIFMPRIASRINLEITGVRVDRLNEISMCDAMAEGIVHQPDSGFGLADSAHYNFADPRFSYQSLWEAINGAGSWEANPWVWVVEFNRENRDAA